MIELLNKIQFKEYIQKPLKPIPIFLNDERVEHLKFGKGIVISIKNDKCIIKFDSGITKELLTRFAKLKRIKK